MNALADLLGIEEEESTKICRKCGRDLPVTSFRWRGEGTVKKRINIDCKECVPGSVKIKKEKTIEEYKDLFHYVSLIKGKLNKKVKTIDIVKSMMPGGSVIGCPKISTLNLLNKQEKENRNIYTGSFGYIKFNGDMRFNIIIRSILNFKNTSEISVASGVVVDSNSSHEFNENFIKAKALIDLFK